MKALFIALLIFFTWVSPASAQVNPADYPADGWNPVPAKYSSCTTELYFQKGYSAKRCYWSFDSSGFTFPYAPFTGELSKLTTQYPRAWIHTEGNVAAEQYFYPDGYSGDGIPNEFREQVGGYWKVVPDTNTYSNMFQSRYSDYKWNPINGATQLTANPPFATADYNVCGDLGFYQRNLTGSVVPQKIVGYRMSCPSDWDYSKNPPPTLEQLNKVGGSSSDTTCEAPFVWDATLNACILPEPTTPDPTCKLCQITGWSPHDYPARNISEVVAVYGDRFPFDFFSGFQPGSQAEPECFNYNGFKLCVINRIIDAALMVVPVALFAKFIFLEKS